MVWVNPIANRAAYVVKFNPANDPNVSGPGDGVRVFVGG
jgi:hypothetical protein